MLGHSVLTDLVGPPMEHGNVPTTEQELEQELGQELGQELEQELEQDLGHDDALTSEQLSAPASDMSLQWSGDDSGDALSMQQTARERTDARRERHREVQRRFAKRKKVLARLISLASIDASINDQRPRLTLSLINQEKLQQDRVLLQQLEARYKLLSLISEQQQLAEDNKTLASSCVAYSLVSLPKPVVGSIIQVWSH
jgi:hypothetical protein